MSSMQAKPRLVFPVISDVHIAPTGEECIHKFERALQQLNARAPKQDAFVIVGDLTNNGMVEEYERHMKIFRQHKLPEAEALIAIGNHDYWNGLPPAQAQARFLDMTGMESIYYHRIIQGHHFIVLATEDTMTHGYFSLQQIEWLSKQLAEAAADAPAQPIFVFLHQHLKDTVYGSEEWGIQDNIEALMNALKPYPQVITFSGHSHYPLNDPRSIHQEHFTSIGTASLSYMEVERGKLQGNLPPGHREFSQGCLVEVYEDRVVIARLDFWNAREIGESWSVKVPAARASFIYTSERDTVKPSFPQHAGIIVDEEHTTPNSVRISFDQAVDDELVHSYRIEVKRADGNEAVQHLAYSEYYNYPLVDKVCVTLPDLQPNQAYELEIHAIDAFQNVSDHSLKAACRTTAVPTSV